MTKQAYIQFQWPREKLELTCYAHRVMNYRYHWHPDMYEVNILLSGQQEYCRDRDTRVLEGDDVVLVPPGMGHSSFGRCEDTCAFVLHFSAGAFRRFAHKGGIFQFPSCFSDSMSRDGFRYGCLRHYCALIWQAQDLSSPLAKAAARAALDLLIVTLCVHFAPQEMLHPEEDEEDSSRRQTIKALIAYIENHFSEKITLDDLASFSGYNRTYLSTLFKNVVGVNFHEYLTRVRFQKALLDLALTDKSLTAVALDNGFSELKTMNALFRRILHRTPAEYRAQIAPERVIGPVGLRYMSNDEPILRQRMAEYLHMPGD